MSEDDQRWVDEVVYYRNLAIMHGAGPNEMTNSWDRYIAETGVSMEPSEDPHRDYESADARREVIDIWDVNERLEGELHRLRVELASWKDAVPDPRPLVVEIDRLRGELRDVEGELHRLRVALEREHRKYVDSWDSMARMSHEERAKPCSTCQVLEGVIDE